MTGALVTFAALMRRVYPDVPVERIVTSMTTGESRGVRGLPARHRPPVWDSPADQPWKRRVRNWHIDQWEKDERRRHPFFRWIKEGSP